MRTKPKRPRDVSQLAKSIVDIATGEKIDPPISKKALSGKAGGLKGGKARMALLTDAQRTELAKQAAAKRWKRDAESAKKPRP